MKAYYNEIDPYAAQWLRNLIDAGEIAPGDVDKRSIVDVTPTDLAGYDRCHFFAGIAGWDYALQLAGWPQELPIWTGSCPCQPFSAAGRGGKGTDERHLWPAWFHLIRVCRPPVIFGEQVASKDGLKWLDLVCSDLEAEGYAVGAADLCAAGVGAPHIRQRLWFVAYSASRIGLRESSTKHIAAEGQEGNDLYEFRSTGSLSILMVNPSSSRCEGDGLQQVWGGRDREGQDLRVTGPSPTGELADSKSKRQGGTLHDKEFFVSTSGNCSTFWSSCLWLPCRDGKARPTEPGIFPLAHGVSARVGRLRAYGNAIVPQVAAEFIRAFMESL